MGYEFYLNYIEWEMEQLTNINFALHFIYFIQQLQQYTALHDFCLTNNLVIVYSCVA